MIFEFTKRARKIIDSVSQTEAVRLGNETIDPEHILLAILKEHDSTAMKILGRLGINFDLLKRTIDKSLLNRDVNFVVGAIPSSMRFNLVVENAKEESHRSGNLYTGTEHLLLALFKEGRTKGIDGLIEAGISYDVIKEEIDKIYNSKGEADNGSKKKSAFPLSDYTSNLTEKASKGLLDPVVGREDEIDRVIRILSRKTKNNPVLIGEAGVGKTAIAEGLAQRISFKNVPDILSNKVILSFDIASIVAGTKYRGEFEDRLKKIINEIKNSSNIILFIDELHTIMGAGAAEGAIDAANILKPFLARSEIQCIGATTLKEYKKYIEKDAALERRFQTVLVKEPSIEGTVKILTGLKETFEQHHKVKYEDSAIEAAARLSARYIRDRFLPDKAIDLLDEAGAKAKLENSFKPEDISEIEKTIDEKKSEKMIYVENQNYEQAAFVRDEIIKLKKDFSKKIADWKNRTGKYAVNVTEDCIKKIISQSTSIPVAEMGFEDKNKILNLEKYLQKEIIGQESAISSICRSLRRSTAGLRRTNRPIGIFLFAGPTGVGKTELAKVLARNYFGDNNSLIRIDMSEYMEKHAVSRLAGSPPGYVGYEDGGQLTEKIKRKPYCVILFDEIEKAHPDFFNILLQIFDEGELTDNSGNKISFRDTLIIMTSNIGNSRFDRTGKLGFAGSSIEENVKAFDEVKKSFNPEFINRIDEIIAFSHLNRDDIKEIVTLMFTEIKSTLLERKINIDFDSKAVDYIAEKGFSEEYGARFLRRIIQTEIEDTLSSKIISADPGEIISIKVICNDAIDFKIETKTKKKRAVLAK
ncbi:MAG TPA: ATP-dependent Clp protease ATP-binding subunit [Spirochaetota bacterium]|jgi:ATP-dependent Clp protease ATP-binding subunit ClpC|nr:ATP-dependent Clp protease ATP-binding subunit [Spirochaetota bacterium]HOH36089.1 ATP-dependent Clp protease ATP-binding subunit [Spirochaetota bacterium]HPM34140.1 ATP-dependent Clp protease ATP-binding subunit [Spirochaetota bacterium]HPY01718.1 ATP-dependent Clp protease ATP-binding subunit [Spirochaetota bacterium]HQA51608.1 ATP-dependent Clp protease ATP-binding subunit [Spirochaetota bacterium]